MTIPRTVFVILIGLFVVGCPGQSTVPRDGAIYQDGAADAPRFTWPDYLSPDAQPAVPDLPKAPDLKPPQDYWPWTPDTYPGSPFGCQQDTDCFGQVCCPTPWGVKLCLDTCQPAP